MRKHNKCNKFIKLIDKNQIIIVLVLIFLFMLVLNILTPYIADDIDYSYIKGTNEKVKNIIDIFISQYNHYMTWGGRSVAHFIAQFFIMLPKIIFNIANSLCYVGIIYKVYTISNKGKKNAWIIILIHLLLFFITPVFGEDFLWLIGSCNYSWTLFIILCILDQYRKDTIKNTWIAKIGIILLGILAGWTNENTGFGLIVMIVLTLLNQKILQKKKIESWKIFGLIGSIIGYIFLLAAPGNYIRSNNYADDLSFLTRYFKRFTDIIECTFQYLWPLFIAFLFLFSYYIYKKKKPEIRSYIYIIGAFVSIFVMIASPTFPERAWVGIVTFLIIGFITLLIPVIEQNRLLKILLFDTIIILSLLSIKYYYQVSIMLIKYNLVINERKEYIKNHPNQDIYYFEIYDGYYKYSPIQGKDITEDKDHWLNESQAKYLNVPAVQGYYQEG